MCVAANAARRPRSGAVAGDGASRSGRDSGRTTGRAACSTRRSRAACRWSSTPTRSTCSRPRRGAAIAGCSRRIPARRRDCSARRPPRCRLIASRAARELQQRYGGTVVLKGAGSIVLAAAANRRGLCDRGNPGHGDRRHGRRADRRHRRHRRPVRRSRRAPHAPACSCTRRPATSPRAVASAACWPPTCIEQVRACVNPSPEPVRVRRRRMTMRAFGARLAAAIACGRPRRAAA